MATLDLPLDQLKQYNGRNPRPADFDAYWERALRELQSTEAPPEIVPAAFQAPGADCMHLFFTGTGGARVHAKFARPKGCSPDQPCPALLWFHGYTGNSGDWLSLLGWVAMGFAVAALDCRGQGGLSEDNLQVKGTTRSGHIIRGIQDDPDKLYFRNVFLDTAQLAHIVMQMPEIDADRVGAGGGSQGGALSLACAALEPRIRRVAPAFPFLCDYQRVWEMDLAKDAYGELTEFFRLHDPTHAQASLWFTRLGYIDVQFLAPWVRGEVLMAVGMMDQTCPPSSQFAAYNKLTAPKQLVIYPDFAHEALPGFLDRIAQFMLGMGEAACD